MRTLFYIACVLGVFVSARIATAEYIYSSLARRISHLAPSLTIEVAELALKASRSAAAKEDGNEVEKLAIIDYSRPSSSKRFWLFDIVTSDLLLEDYVAHGKNTGENESVKFSNELNSLQSSIGLFRIGNPYIGKHGNSLRLIGLEPGFNDKAYARDIVIHGADYVSSDFIKSHQRLGRSFGCPALSPSTANKVIEYFKNSNGYLFSYYPDDKWLSNSNFIGGVVRQ